MVTNSFFAASLRRMWTRSRVDHGFLWLQRCWKFHDSPQRDHPRITESCRTPVRFWNRPCKNGTGRFCTGSLGGTPFVGGINDDFWSRMSSRREWHWISKEVSSRRANTPVLPIFKLNFIQTPTQLVRSSLPATCCHGVSKKKRFTKQQCMQSRRIHDGLQRQLCP